MMYEWPQPGPAPAASPAAGGRPVDARSESGRARDPGPMIIMIRPRGQAPAFPSSLPAA